MIKFLFFIGVFLLSTNIFSQEIISALQVNEFLQKKPKIKTLSKSVNILPFIDDFSNNVSYPSSTRWQDNFVFINRTYPVNPISIGVATFDGLDSLGFPYDINSSNLDGNPADYLTSNVIDLSSVDTAFILFYYQPQGIGDMPQIEDSLILQFLTDAFVWETIWAVEGGPIHEFERKVELIHQPEFLHSDFQFRFMNYATLSGNYDHWNIDYVELDIFTSPDDTSILNDISFVYNSPSFLKRYREMPWTHFKNDFLQELVDTLDVKLRNNDAEESVDYKYEVFEIGGSSVPISVYPNIPPRNVDVWDYLDSGLYYFANPPVSVDPNVFLSSATDSVAFLIQHIIKPDPSTEIPGNDTLQYQQNFYSHFAYDDGTPEFAYGINVSGSMAALQFKANRPDTLRAIQMYFPQMLNPVNNIHFNLTIWDDNNGEPGNIIYSELVQPKHTSKGDFYPYHLDTPIQVTDIFYIGWEQTTPDLLNIGLDKNSPSNDYMFYNIAGNSIWNRSQFSGAWMMRPVLSQEFIFLSNNDYTPRFKIYPNPSNNFINIDFDSNDKKHIYLFDINGKIIYSLVTLESHVRISNQDLSPGLYFVKISTIKGQIYDKLIIR